MKRHFLAFCLISVVSLAAALVFYSCSASDFLKEIDGTITVNSSEGFVGKTFYAFYQGKDGDKIDGWWWSYESGGGSGPGSPYPGQKYSSMFTATHAGTLRVSVQVSRLGYKGISSDRIYVYVDPNILPQYQDNEVDSRGKLTITGLEKYNNTYWKIEASTPEERPKRIYAFKTAYNTYDSSNGSTTISSRKDSAVTVSDSQAVFKLFVINNVFNYDRYVGYIGNDQNVRFDIVLNTTLSSSPPTPPVYGTVTVNFANGEGSGAFVLNP